MDELIKAMSDDELQLLKEKHADEPSVILLLDGILETREREHAKEEGLTKVKIVVAKVLTKTLPPEEDYGIYNIHATRCEVEVDDGEPEEVEVVAEDGSKTMEMRAPKHKEYQWIVTVNHAVKVVSGSNGTPATSKRGIQCWRRDGANLVDLGRFHNKQAACDHLGYGVEVGVGSASLPLAAHGIIVEPYNGSDYTS